MSSTKVVKCRYVVFFFTRAFNLSYEFFKIWIEQYKGATKKTLQKAKPYLFENRSDSVKFFVLMCFDIMICLNA